MSKRTIEKLDMNRLQSMSDSQLRAELSRLSHKISNRSYEIIKSGHITASKGLRTAVLRGYIKPSKDVVSKLGIKKKDYVEKRPRANEKWTSKDVKDSKGAKVGEHKLKTKDLINEIAERVEFVNNVKTSTKQGTIEYEKAVGELLLGKGTMEKMSGEQTKAVWDAIDRFRKKHPGEFYYINDSNWRGSQEVLKEVQSILTNDDTHLEKLTPRGLKSKITRRLNEYFKKYYETEEQENEDPFSNNWKK